MSILPVKYDISAWTYKKPYFDTFKHINHTDIYIHGYMALCGAEEIPG